jgi:hypothetical protein
LGGYSTLALLSALSVLPLLALALRPVRTEPAPDVAAPGGSDEPEPDAIERHP